MMKLEPDRKIDVKEVLKDLQNYQPRRRGWHWREEAGKRQVGEFEYREVSKGLKNSVPLPAAKSFENIDPQSDCTITTEIASGRFEDDIRRMRMAAWHGADHIMVIRTAGQSHFDGLIEGTPEGVGGVPITRKEVRATRKALDWIEDEVGRPINFHSYVSGVAGPEIAVMFAEEGVNGAHQDPQYNVLYRNINMVRSFVDAAEAKRLMAYADMLQIDGAHNANATADKGWKVMPELMVQHGLNAAYSVRVGMKKENIALSTVPPTAPPAPCLRIDLPYAVALRELFRGYRMRAQMNTKYVESDMSEAVVTHTLNVLISRLAGADIQSTITPDEGRNVPWHYNSISAVDNTKQALIGLDGLDEMVTIKRDGEIADRIRELKERAVLFLEEILEAGGYFNAVEKGFFIDSGCYPERVGDGIARHIDGGVGAGTVVKRDKEYMAPVCEHFGYNNIPDGIKPCSLIGGCTLCRHEKIAYIDELDDTDNVNVRLKEAEGEGGIKPEVEWRGDGFISSSIFLPTDERTAEAAALEIGKRLGLNDVSVIHRRVMQQSEGTLIEIKGRVPFSLDPSKLKLPTVEEALSDEQIKEYVGEHPIKVVAATLGEDEHSVGLKEIIDIKHGGIEKYGIECIYLGTSCPVEKAVDAAIEADADAILASTIITHNDIHIKNMKALSGLCIEKGIRDNIILIGGGTQVTDEVATSAGFDRGFGRGTTGRDVASYLVKREKG